MTAVALQHRETVIARVAAGDKLIDIAKDLGLSTHAAISKALAKDPDYLIARETGAEARLETRESELEEASDSVTVARTRELLSHARWRCEREFPDRWGTRPTIVINQNLALDQSSVSSIAQILEERPKNAINPPAAHQLTDFSMESKNDGKDV